jgi:hypothetical protein
MFARMLFHSCLTYVKKVRFCGYHAPCCVPRTGRCLSQLDLVGFQAYAILLSTSAPQGLLHPISKISYLQYSMASERGLIERVHRCGIERYALRISLLANIILPTEFNDEREDLQDQCLVRKSGAASLVILSMILRRLILQSNSPQ